MLYTRGFHCCWRLSALLKSRYSDKVILWLCVRSCYTFDSMGTWVKFIIFLYVAKKFFLCRFQYWNNYNMFLYFVWQKKKKNLALKSKVFFCVWMLGMLFWKAKPVVFFFLLSDLNLKKKRKGKIIINIVAYYVIFQTPYIWVFFTNALKSIYSHESLR